MAKIILFLLGFTVILFGLYHLFTNLDIRVKLWFAKKSFIAICCFMFVVLVSVCIVTIF